MTQKQKKKPEPKPYTGLVAYDEIDDALDFENQADYEYDFDDDEGDE